MTHNYTIRPVFLAHKANSLGMANIRIAITVNRKVTYMTTEHKIHQTQWNDTTRQVTGHENAALMNVALRRRIADIEKEIISRNLEGVPITRRVIKGDGSVDRPFPNYAREIRANEKEIRRLIAYAGGTFMLSEMNVAFLRRYEQYERNRGMANNTINTTFKYLRRILTQATIEKLIRENPFDHYDVPKYRQTERVYLTREELDQLLDIVDDLDRSLKITAFNFLLGCFSGLRHSDWVRFDHARMVEGDFLKLRAKKNQKDVVLPIGPTLRRILDAVRELPPPVSNQKCNVMLKAIGAVAGIRKPLTTHVARHSFGYMCASNKIPKSVAAELMGVHSSTVEVYYHLSGQNIIDQASVLKTL
jgi:site-specific recombinase XerD